MALFPVLDLAGSVHGVGLPDWWPVPAGIGAASRLRWQRCEIVRGLRVVPAVRRLWCAGCWCLVLAGMAKATSWGLLVAFGALCALGVYWFIRWGISSCSSWPVSVVVV